MNKVRLKQRKLFKIMKALIIFSAVFIFVYIGAQPAVAEYSQTLALIIKYFCDIIVVAILIMLFMYYSKYGKCDSFLTQIENEINDNGCYLTSREENNIEDFVNVMSNDLQNCRYSVNRNLEVCEFDFAIKAVKSKEFFYAVSIDSVDRNDVLAYLDSVIQDITVKSLKRKGNAVLCFVTENAADDAIALSKMITPIGKKEQLKIAIAICEMSSRRVYFLGNVQTKCQQMIANFVMNCNLPIKDKYICNEKLQFQYDLEDKMQNFTIKDYLNGNFTVH